MKVTIMSSVLAITLPVLATCFQSDPLFPHNPINGRLAVKTRSPPFLQRHRSSRNPTPSSSSSSLSLHAVFSLGDVFSGMTGIPPSSLNPPLELLSGTSIDPESDRVDLQCVYKASKDGWSAVDFHRCVDGRGSGLVVGLSKSGKKFGGFNPLGWMSTDDYCGSTSAWLWFQGAKGPTKLPVMSGGNAAVFDYATSGPCFGASDLVVGPPRAAVMGGFAGPDMEDNSVNAGSLREGKSDVGGAYDFVSGWPCRGSFGISEIEVYCNANIEPIQPTGFKWPFF